MNPVDLKKQRERLFNWTSMLSIFPSDSAEGKAIDQFWQRRLDEEIQEIDEKLSVNTLVNSLNSLSRAKNNLLSLSYQVVGNDRKRYGKSKK